MVDTVRLMVVVAHSDDAEIWAGGTIITHTDAGMPALIVVLAGSANDLRGQEQCAAARLTGTEIIFGGARDRFIAVEPALVERVAIQFAAFRPHYLITHWHEDSHPDHVATSQIARRAVLTAEVENDLRGAMACDTYLGWGMDGPFVPQLYVDISAVWRRKLEAIQCFASQDPDHYTAIAEHQCWLHGARICAGYAEAYRYLPFFGRADSARPWPLTTGA